MLNADAHRLAEPVASADIAVIGLACRFPGARNADEFWENLEAGRESLRDVSDEEYLAAGGDPELLGDPDLVLVASDFPDMDCFDARFFGYSPAEAEVLDPQQRIFLECGYHALEDAGYYAGDYAGTVGVYAGADESMYFVENLHPGLRTRSITMTSFATQMASTPGLLPTRLSYHLGLRGPSVFVQTTCSTSLVAVHLACQDLLNYAADMAVAGGISINPTLRRGYRHTPDGPFSPDGRCRAFSADAAGMSGGNGAGLVVLKRLADALADRDNIRAVIKGTAINNDGNRKVGLFAPSVQGQVEVIVAAQELAGVSAADISYVEAHGTGTLVGDPIEVTALTEAFARGTDRRQFCALGSVKTNFGHLVAAAGVASLIKTVLALEHRIIPPSLNFSRPNPLIDFASTPFWVVTTPTPWQSGNGSRRAGVSSFGFGGTNAHAVVQEAPSRPVRRRSPGWSVLPLAAKTPQALEAMTRQLGEYLRAHPELGIADVAHTLQSRGGPYPHRGTAVCRSVEDAAVRLLGGGADLGHADTTDRSVAFLFPGAGAQYDGMGLDLYRGEPVFRKVIDDSAEILRPVLGYDLRSVLYDEQNGILNPEGPDPGAAADGAGTAAATGRSPVYPAVVATEYALATLLVSRGVRPVALLGHSLGEYTAACLAGVYTLEDVLPLVAERERLIASVGGRTLRLRLDANQCAARYLTGNLSLAAVNAPDACVVSGSDDEIAELEARLAGDRVDHQRLRTPGAVHSALLDPVLDELAAALGKVRLRAPQLPFVSCLTGTYITPDQATDPDYWVRHTRRTAQFAQGLTTLHANTRPVLLEVGPGQGLARLAQLQLGSGVSALPAMRRGCGPDHDQALHDDQQFLYRAIGQLWTLGVPLEWALVSDQRGWRVSLPGYPFERERFWIDPPSTRPASDGLSAGESGAGLAVTEPAGTEPAEIEPAGTEPAGTGLYGVSWRRCVDLPRLDPAHVAAYRWIVLSDRSALAGEFVHALSEGGADPVLVVPGAEFRQVETGHFVLAPEHKEHYARLLRAVNPAPAPAPASAPAPLRIVDFWASLTNSTTGLDLVSTLGIAHAVGSPSPGRGTGGSTAGIELCQVTCGAFAITGGEQLNPRAACSVAASQTLGVELPQISTRIVDIDPAEAVGGGARLARSLLPEFSHPSSVPPAGYRAGRRWLRHFEPLPTAELPPSSLRDGGVYVITGGLGNVGRCVAGYLARECRARLVLVGRSASADQVPPGLRDLGGEVLVRCADVGNRAQITAVLDETRQRFGAIHGIVHAAGVLADDGMLPALGPEAVARTLWAKVSGTEALFDVIRETGTVPDFVALFSSLAALSGAPGLACHAAANAFLDTFATHASRDLGIPTVSINWGQWLGLNPASDARLHQGLVEAGMDVDTALAAFGSCLAVVSAGQLLVSSVPPDELFDLVFAETTAAISEIGTGTGPPAAEPAPAETTLQRDIAAIWAETLGVTEVGLHDNFFMLGGDSMLALQVVQRCKDRLNLTVTVQQLLTTRTVADLVLALTGDDSNGHRPT